MISKVYIECFVYSTREPGVQQKTKKRRFLIFSCQTRSQTAFHQHRRKPNFIISLTFTPFPQAVCSHLIAFLTRPQTLSPTSHGTERTSLFHSPLPLPTSSVFSPGCFLVIILHYNQFPLTHDANLSQAPCSRPGDPAKHRAMRSKSSSTGRRYDGRPMGP